MSLLKKNKFFVWIVIIIVILVLLNVFQKEVRGFFYHISAPIQKVLWRAGDSTSDFFWGVFASGALKEKADQLELKNQKLLSQIVSLKELEQENQTLREALDIGLQEEFKLSFAKIVGKDSSQDFILIDKGSVDGITKDMPVITGEKVLIGRIHEVYSNSSKVMLISNKESVFDAKVLSQSTGVIKGDGSLLFFDLILKDEAINEDDVVITSSISGIFPGGLLVGKVKNINNSNVGSFQQAEVEPYLNLSLIEDIFIILEF